MKKRRIPKIIQVVFLPDSEGYWLAEFPQLPGLQTFGTSLKDAKRRAKEALTAWFAQHEKLRTPVRVR